MAYILVRECPDAIQKALAAIGYHRKDIEVTASTDVCLGSCGGDGYRAIAVVGNLVTGRYEIRKGSWGGPNPWSPNNAVDNDFGHHPLPVEGFAITGDEGGTERSVYATLHVNPASVNPSLLPAPCDLSEAEKAAMYCYLHVRSGNYRTDALREKRVLRSTVDGLVAKGLLTRNKAGSVTPTVAGKNCGVKGDNGW